MKLKSKKGLTLVEMLCSVAILVLVSMIMVLGVQLGVRSYAKSVSYSEAQVLCSTLTTAISDELRYSGSLQIAKDGTLEGFFSQQYGELAYTGFTSTSSGHVQLGGKDLLPAKAYPYGIRAEVAGLSYNAGAGVFTVNLTVKDSENKTVLAETEFEVKKLNVTKEDIGEAGARALDAANARSVQNYLKSLLDSGAIRYNGAGNAGVWIVVSRGTSSDVFPDSYGGKTNGTFFCGADTGVSFNGVSKTTSWNTESDVFRQMVESSLGTLQSNAGAPNVMDNDIGGWDWYVVQYTYNSSTRTWEPYIFSGKGGATSDYKDQKNKNTGIEKYLN